MQADFLISRPRRNRKHRAIRALVQETRVTIDDLIVPLFLIPGHNVKEAITSMPGYYRYSLDLLLQECKFLWDLGLKCLCLFPVIPAHLKTARCQEALNKDGIYQRAIKSLKDKFPNLLLMTDVALDPYSSLGHDGLIDPQSGDILNDETLDILGQMALIQAEAGADIIGPSDMMDGRVRYIRNCLDANGFSKVSIMSYTAKYASAFYGPFREALDSTPKLGDKKTYQMDYRNSREALREAELDINEGADILMVKPGLAYLDIIKGLKEFTSLPIAAYNVSGEYAMIKAASQNGWVDEPAIVWETLTAFKRAGADIILTYFAAQVAQLLSENL